MLSLFLDRISYRKYLRQQQIEREKERYRQLAVNDGKCAFGNVRYLTSVRGNTLLELNDQRYTLNRQKDSSLYWECVKKRNKTIKCNARIVTVDGFVKSVRGCHNHIQHFLVDM